MGLGPPQVVDGVAPQPPLYTLVGAATAADPTVVNGPEDVVDRWINGLLVRGYPCGPAGTYDICGGSSDVEIPAPAEPPEVFPIEPFPVALTVKCHVYHGSAWADNVQMATTAFKALEYAEVERLFWLNQLAKPNATVLNGGAAANTRHAMGSLEECIAAKGIRGMIHAPAAVASDLVQSGGASKEGTRLVTPLGSALVPGSGYPGTGPNGEVPSANQYWVYATEMVRFWRETSVRVVPDNAAQAVRRSDNTLELVAERVYALEWAQCVHSAILVDRSKTTF